MTKMNTRKNVLKNIFRVVYVLRKGTELFGRLMIKGE